MERMIVVVFESEKAAYEGVSALRQLDREGSISVFAAAVLEKKADGTTVPKQVDELNLVGTLVGSSVGALIGLIGGPAGVALGAVSGMGLGVLADISHARVGYDFVDDVAQALRPGTVALIAEVEESWVTPLDARMEALGGVVIRRALTDVKQQMRKEEIAAIRADIAKMEEELRTANAERKAKLQAGIDRLRTKLEDEQKRAQAWFEAFQARRKARAEAFEQRASAAAHAIGELAKTPPL